MTILSANNEIRGGSRILS